MTDSPCYCIRYGNPRVCQTGERLTGSRTGKMPRTGYRRFVVLPNTYRGHRQKRSDGVRAMESMQLCGRGADRQCHDPTRFVFVVCKHHNCRRSAADAQSPMEGPSTSRHANLNRTDQVSNNNIKKYRSLQRASSDVPEN